MASCPSCQQQISVLFCTVRPSVILENLFRSPGRRIVTCEKCGARLMLTPSSFVICQVIAILVAIPSAIGFARLRIWLINSVGIFQRFAAESPGAAAFLMWILPTVMVTLILYSLVAGQFVEFQIADS
jgi:hypothetical protein